ncbi:MAG: molybdopterin-binding oxidoreductase, partial [Bryobacterales bacterium]|nr:molybdopterin-binding oxidoreductase [Bryobacterales bacterium]
DRAAWKVRVEGTSASAAPVEVPLAEIKALPRAEHVTELKCIEGWSEIVHWGGVRFADFAKKYPPAAGMRYVGMETPDGEYYVGLDMASAMHPQTLLCFEMSGQPLTEKHGAPLRLCIPTKYGIKNIKQLGKIAYTRERPDDYWAERGYDWYAGL